MANIQNLYIIKAEDDSIVNAEISYDLSVLIGGQEVPKEVSAAYIVDNGDGTFTEYNYNKKGSKYVTKVTNPLDGKFAYLKEKSGEVSDLLAATCDVCTSSNKPTTPVEIVSSCEKPLFVSICDNTDKDHELIITDPLPICAKICSGDSNDLTCGLFVCLYEQWYVRERIVWDSVNFVEVSKDIEFSNDGINWTNVQPENTFFGKCPKTATTEFSDCQPSISEAFGDDISVLESGNNFLITKPSCCKVLVETSVGSFHIKSGVQSYASSDFQCQVDILGVTIVEGNCSLNQIQIITNKIK